MNNQDAYRRLRDFEVTPPQLVWSGIEMELNEPNLTNLQERLSAFEATPSQTNWNELENKLYPTTEKKPILLQRSWLRYGVAAALLVLLATSIFLFVNNTGTTSIAKQSVPATPRTENKNTPAQNTDEEKQEVEAPADVASSSENDLTNITEKNQPDRTTSVKTAVTKRYLTFLKDNGEKVRLSKKVFPVFNCADNATASIQQRCKESIESLQQKMASSLTATTTDFSGLIDMIKTLEENN